MKPRIETLSETKLIGKQVTMSYTNNKTKELWQSFMPKKAEIKDSIGNELYSVEVYDTDFFMNFNPTKEFNKWAAIRVSNFDLVPEELKTITIPEGLYAVFHYKGKASKASNLYHYIYGTWVPNSEYKLDDRPHFAVMGEKYKNEHPDSEEELWIPIKKKCNHSV